MIPTTCQQTNGTSRLDRGVSPVIGVILMVAITVILAAVIAAFVLDIGDSVQQEAQAGVSIDVAGQNVTVQVTSMGNADYVELGGNVDETVDDRLEVGDSLRLNTDDGLEGASGTVTAIAVIEDSDVRTTVGSQDYDFR